MIFMIFYFLLTFGYTDSVTTKGFSSQLKNSSTFFSLSKNEVRYIDLWVMKEIKKADQATCLNHCRMTQGCVKAIHCQPVDSCKPDTFCINEGKGTCYLMSPRGRRLVSQTSCSATKEVPPGCQTEPTFMNQGAVRTGMTHRPGFPVVIEYECGQVGAWSYKRVGGSSEATCDEDGKWTLPALQCIPTNCFILNKLTPDLLKPWYAGNVSQDVEGHICQNWSSNFPHKHHARHQRSSLYPGDGSVQAAGNKCRGIGTHMRYPWCYITGSETRTNVCNVTRCDEVIKCGTPPFFPGSHPIKTEIDGDEVRVTYKCHDILTYYGGSDTATCNTTTDMWTLLDMLCFSTKCYYIAEDTTDKAMYNGNVSTTVSGRTCQSFASQSPHHHKTFKDTDFPGDTSLEDVGNKCRGPDASGYTWCYTMDPKTRWETCPIPECKMGR